MRHLLVCSSVLLLLACHPDTDSHSNAAAQPNAPPLPPPCQDYLDYLQRCQTYLSADNATEQQLFTRYREQALQMWQQEADQAKLAQSCRDTHQQLHAILKPQGCE